ncbi:helix-turn-helix transcriptional regulator [Chitinophaga nivalis]|uniref:WYL domain-containing protein n=1 Tax=Chitinophaga nivalis TaxID=2991709 RepID=A0ABT3IP41_9BACT|nr:WYL domain-containing protein [Chitinophaga nivalis]MCW3464601.1 WYL domain-containing protein [Chitinophaga nivalis]MCW3485708.1 WYL domain-containing protein [Chitinophaga nivalis]
MSINKLALIRYKTIDECLRNRYRKWTLEDLIDKVATVLYNYEGIDSGVSKRTIQADIQLMRSDKLGYNAPIIVKERKYYTYSDTDFSITNAPINSGDVDKMKEIVSVLKQFNGFHYFDEMSDMIARLENNLYKSGPQHRSCIQLENNHRLQGLEHINGLYQAALHRKALLLEYKSFKAAKAKEHICYPYLLKEYRNRWFLLARTKNAPQLQTMALDRIISFQELPREKFMDYDGVDFEQYYANVIGVTKSEKEVPHKVVLQIDQPHAPYVLTKPLHASQELLAETPEHIIIRIEVICNYELEREILGFGDYIKVLSPRSLATRIQKRLEQAAARYK